MKKFLVLYLAPVTVLDEWKKTDPATRKPAEEKMQAAWKKWLSDHAASLADKGSGVGKTKRLNAQGASDTQNQIMLYALAQAETHDAAVEAFAGHPHLGIPQATIEIMELHSPLDAMN